MEVSEGNPIHKKGRYVSHTRWDRIYYPQSRLGDFGASLAYK